MGSKRERSTGVLQGTLDLLILKTIGSGSMHGYDIAEAIHRKTDDVLRVDEGALYQALHRLELRGSLASQWGTSSNGRRAKYYRLTAAGRRYLAEESAEFSRLSGAVLRILEA